MSEEKKQDIREMVEVLNDLNRDDLMKTVGFAMGLKASGEAQAENQSGQRRSERQAG